MKQTKEFGIGDYFFSSKLRRKNSKLRRKNSDNEDWQLGLRFDNNQNKKYIINKCFHLLIFQRMDPSTESIPDPEESGRRMGQVEDVASRLITQIGSQHSWVTNHVSKLRS